MLAEARNCSIVSVSIGLSNKTSRECNIVLDVGYNFVSFVRRKNGKRFRRKTRVFYFILVAISSKTV